MYTLTFNGYFEVEYPNEFLAELEELKEKHGAYFFGQPILQDLGHYVDFQKEDSKVENVVENKSTEQSDEEI
jgi:hypothetical protein